MASNSMWKRWERSHPSKVTVLWSCIGTVLMTMIIGFTWGGWMTTGRSELMAAGAVHEARTELMATLCVNRFINFEDVADQLADFQKSGSWEQRDIVRNGGWTNVGARDQPLENAVNVCAERIAGLKLPQAVTLQ